MKIFFFYNIDILAIYTALSLALIHKLSLLNLTSTGTWLITIGNILLVAAAYTFNRTRDHLEDKFNGQGRNVKPSLLLSVSAVAALVALWLYTFVLGISGFISALLLILCSYFYSGNRIRLKRFFILKNLLPALCWFFSLIFVVNSSGNNFDLLAVKLLLPFFILFFLFEIIWDLPDIRGDKQAGISTFPVIIGFRKTQLLLLLALLLIIFLSHSVQNRIISLLIFSFLISVTEKTPKSAYRYFLLCLTLGIAILNFLPQIAF